MPDEIRAEVKAINDAEGADGLRARLMPHDPELAERLGTGDRQRLARAYEVWLATGRSLMISRQSASPGAGRRPMDGVALTPPRSALQKIDRRFEGMLMQGAMAEARALVARGSTPNCQS